MFVINCTKMHSYFKYLQRDVSQIQKENMDMRKNYFRKYNAVLYHYTVIN